MSGPTQTQPTRSVYARNVSPTIALINDLASRGAHRPRWHEVQHQPRLGQGICACGWKGSVGTGAIVYQELRAHAEATLPAAAPSDARSDDRPVDLAHAIVSLASAAERRRGARADLVDATDTIAAAIRKQLRNGDTVVIGGDNDGQKRDAVVTYRSAAVGSLGFEDPDNERHPFVGPETDVLLREKAILGPLPQGSRQLIDEIMIHLLREAQQGFDLAHVNGKRWPEIYVDSFLLHPATAAEREAFAREAPAVIEAFREMLERQAEAFNATATKTTKLTPR